MKASLRPVGAATAALTSLPLIALPASGSAGYQVVCKTHVGGPFFGETVSYSTQTSAASAQTN